MSDSRTQEVERLAKAGDPDAQRELARLKARNGDGPVSQHVGNWVLLVGVRCHYRGKILRTRTIHTDVELLCHPLYELDSFYDEDQESFGKPQGGGPRFTTEERPGSVMLSTLLDVTAQPPDWPTE